MLWSGATGTWWADLEWLQAIQTLFPHHVGHYVGLDVHDTPGVSRREPLRAGQCVTVEP